MNKSELINELAAALAKAQGEMDAAKMDTKNQFGGKYADLGSIISAAKKPLTSNGLSVSQHPELSDGKVTVTTILMHSSGQWLESSISAPIGDNRALSAAQQAGIVITYLRRYAFSAIVGIYADEDTDGQSKQPAQKQQPQRQPEPASVTAARELGGVVVDAPPMTYEEACAVENSKGQRYGDIDTATLEGMVHGINIGIKKPGADIATYQMKLQAIGVILAARAVDDEAARQAENE
jgi:hypothetical protein